MSFDCFLPLTFPAGERKKLRKSERRESEREKKTGRKKMKRERERVEKDWRLMNQRVSEARFTESFLPTLSQSEG